jgi:hypothetical protein
MPQAIVTNAPQLQDHGPPQPLNKGADSTPRIGLICPMHHRRRWSMQNAHESALAAKHAGLDKKIEAEMQRPSPNQIRLAELKKQKLKIKEQLYTH